MMDTEFRAEAEAVAQMGNLDQVLAWMKLHGSSVVLNWGEEHSGWECSWITGGDRFTYVGISAKGAAVGAMVKCLKGNRAED